MVASTSTPTKAGLLYVTMNPKLTLAPEAFEDWYNNEHGPTRLKLPFFPNGFRYRATDLKAAGSKEQPEWMALYDIPDMQELTKEPYMRLRSQPVKSPREAETMAQIDVDRKLLDFVGKDVNEKDYVELEKIENADKENILAAASLIVDKSKIEEVDKYFQENVFKTIQSTPGWRRTRRFQTSSIDTPKLDGTTEYLITYEFAPGTSTSGLDLLGALPFDIKQQTIRHYALYYIFGPANRHLSSQTASWAPTDPADPFTKTTAPTSPDFGAAIKSYIYSPDNFRIHYRLEGSHDPNAPLIVLSNSVLVTWGIWDGFVKSFFSVPENRKYRILRYLSRGRVADTGSQPVTIDVLASDIITLLDALKVKKAALSIGVSQGGATALAAGVTYPDRIENFIACDTSAKSPAGNKETWAKRIELADKEASKATIGPFGAIEVASSKEEPVAIVGEELSEVTVRRWFTETSYKDESLVPELERVKQMVYTNSLDGFKNSVAALYSYDYVDAVKNYAGPGRGAFLVGAQDGALPKGMEAISKELGSAHGKSGAFKAIESAGHLPMVEKPVEVAEFVTEFLRG